MAPTQIVPGLWRWTACHPEHDPRAEPGSSGDWDPLVGSALFQQPSAVALFDPLVPAAERETFLRWLDERAAAVPVSILTTNPFHRRDRDELADRYRSHGGPAWNAVPAGVQPRPLRGAGETLYWIAAVAALVVGDRLVGGDGRALSVCPESWLADVRVDRAGLAALLTPLLELPIERVLVSHGEPVLSDGRAAIARAIEQAR
jgi:hypothetical protein